MAQTITYHASGATIPQRGVAQGPKALPSSFQGIDPLSRAGEQANKPGSSIPTIFARMIFFHTSFKNVDKSTIGGVNGTSPVYNQVVSQCFDLLEMIFNHDRSLKFVEWNQTEQIEKLKKSGHEEIADALESHFNKYLKGYGLNSLYLVLKQGATAEEWNVIGGTSPFTIVFTSPNWNSHQPVKPLLDRDPKFKEYIYSVYAALNNDISKSSEEYKAIAGFMQYVADTSAIEPDKILKSRANSLNYTTQDLQDDYPPIILDKDHKVAMPAAAFQLANPKSFTDADGITNTITTADLYLAGRKKGALKSDFFLNSDLDKTFDEIKTPLILAEGLYHTRFYYDTVRWNDNTKVPQIVNDRQAVRQLPGAPAIEHLYFTTIDFLEQKLIQLPYEIDSNHFHHVLNIDGKGYFLPFKPLLIAHFGLEKIGQMLVVNEVRDHNGNVSTLKVTLKVPIRNNAGNPTGVVELKRDYDMMKDVVSLAQYPVSIGIAPFFRLSDDNLNRYTVIYQHGRLVNYGRTSLSFYDFGKKNPDVGDSKSRGLETISEFYRLRSAFDAIRISFDEPKSENAVPCAGMVLPNFDEHEYIGGNHYYYSIDFGTTNTHIALAVSGNDDPRSFNSDDIRSQAVYLAAVPQKVKDAIRDHNDGQAHNAMENVYGLRGKNIKMAQERQFYPNFIGNEYNFPIRTVTGQNSTIDDLSEIYSGASIGFRFSKELVMPADTEIKYNTDVKWALETGSGAEVKYRAALFFHEILEMIRTHWLSQTGANLEDTPSIILTYPLAMSNVAMMARLWGREYAKVFGVNESVATRKIVRMPESLAPAYSLIHDGHLPVAGLLNVDIGGGTTDIQYYRISGNDKYAFYNSVRFAGDDLWGTGYENIPNAPGGGVKENIFTTFAKEKLKDDDLIIDMDKCRIVDITKTGKEFINVLLRDSNKLFIEALSTPDTNICRKVIFLHYGAIMYHIVNLLMSRSEETGGTFPATLNFTGFGSKYIETLFGEGHNDKLIAYTKELIVAFGFPKDRIPDNFTIKFDENPKAATAEGAALYARDKADRKDTIDSRTAYHYGFATPVRELRRKDISAVKPDVIKYFDEFIKASQSVTMQGVDIPHLTSDEAARLRVDAMTSFDQVESSTAAENDSAGENQIKDSIFFWTLKGSLFNLN